MIAVVTLNNRSTADKPLNIKNWSVAYFDDEKSYIAGLKPMAIEKGFLTFGSSIAAGGVDKASSSNVDARPDRGRTATFSQTMPGAGVVVGSFITRNLTEKTVRAGKTVSGRVFFDMKGKSQFRLITLVIDSVSYVFPVPKDSATSTPPADDPAKAKKVFWSGDSACGLKNSNVTVNDNFKCAEIDENGRRYQKIEYNGLELLIGFDVIENYLAVEVRMKNASDSPKTFFSNDWTIVNFTDLDAFKSGAKPISGSSSVPQPKIVDVPKSTGNRELQEGDRKFQADLGKNTGTRDDKGVIRTENPNPAALSARSISYQKIAVLSETAVPAKSEITGDVYFVFDHVANFRFVTITVDGVFHVFPVFK